MELNGLDELYCWGSYICPEVVYKTSCPQMHRILDWNLQIQNICSFTGNAKSGVYTAAEMTALLY